MQNYIQIAKLIRCCGKVEGRVKLQKIVHILQEMDHPFREEFGYLHHGPYSSDLKSEIDQLVSWKLIDEEPEQAGEYSRYDYSASDTFATILDGMGDEGQPQWAELARELNKKTSQELEAISTIMFLRSRDFDGGRLKDRFVALKPHLKDRFDLCFAEAEKLREGCRAALRG